MRRRLSFAVAAAAIAVPFAGAAAVHGCSNEQPFESVCLWVADPDNCYRKFRIDTEGSGTDCKPFGDPTQVDLSTGSLGAQNGAFLGRDKLDICFINGGGQVIFDPPVDLANFPPSLLSQPVTYKMVFKKADGNECGNASYSSPHGFTFTVNGPPDAGGSSSDAGAFVSTDGGDGGPGQPYGSYSQVIQPGRDAFDVTCPSGETHHLNLFEVEGQSITDDGGLNGTCPVVQDLVPRAAFVVDPGGVDTPGAISFTIYWPPTGAGVTYPDIDAGIDSLASNGHSILAQAVTYFNCGIGAAPQVCVNGIKDGTETDVDCGGKETRVGCPARCGDGQACVTDCDCDTSMLCTVKAGVKVCGAPTDADGGIIPVPARDCSSYTVCLDKQQDSSETDVDCGGPDCPARCADGQKCLVGTDCTSGYCVNKICTTPDCMNSIKDPGEIDTDCGGVCPPCGNGKTCTQNADCVSGNCVNMLCADAKCTDGAKNGSETDVDCGGVCPACDNLKACVVNLDCKSKACVNGQCLFPSCVDNVQDGFETDKDCGGLASGSGCPTCADGAGCLQNTDCTSNLCGFATATAQHCFPASCLADGGVGSTDICGGGVCPLCADGKACMTNADCFNNGCVSGQCATPTCGDLTMDGQETDVDCGGPKCGGCAPGKKCNTDNDCASGKADAGADAGTNTICINKVCQQ